MGAAGRGRKDGLFCRADVPFGLSGEDFYYSKLFPNLLTKTQKTHLEE